MFDAIFAHARLLGALQCHSPTDKRPPKYASQNDVPSQGKNKRSFAFTLELVLYKKSSIHPALFGQNFGGHFILMAGAEGIEPSSTVLETAVLPLNHAPSARYYSETRTIAQEKTQ